MLNRPAAGAPWRLVLDTNVLLSLWAFGDPHLRWLDEALSAGAVALLTNQACGAEFARVLTYPGLGFGGERIAAVRARHDAIARPVTELPAQRIALPTCRDPDDQKFLELARDGGAHFLVTSDKALLALARRRPMVEHFAIVHPERLAHRLAPRADVPRPRAG